MIDLTPPKGRGPYLTLPVPVLETLALLLLALVVLQ